VKRSFLQKFLKVSGREAVRAILATWLAEVRVFLFEDIYVLVLGSVDSFCSMCPRKLSTREKPEGAESSRSGAKKGADAAEGSKV
jgi:hypothetical protein